jgi:hypothetical protein
MRSLYLRKVCCGTVFDPSIIVRQQLGNDVPAVFVIEILGNPELYYILSSKELNRYLINLCTL